MAGCCGHVGFFCLRAPAGIKREPRADALWLFGSIISLDISRQIIIKEAMAIGTIVPGVFSYGDLLRMKYRDYEKTIVYAKEIKDKQSNG